MRVIDPLAQVTRDTLQLCPGLADDVEQARTRHPERSVPASGFESLRHRLQGSPNETDGVARFTGLGSGERALGAL
jgi:hypothetical protein